ncbi:uncharacterized protein LOC135389662 [Ornithodoros turicata]|uniref:uncharacterized protein LOC135389662 n=1 Tax=Ornithodoros turicata TaxID=34597 RepID=UPI00313A0739
MTPFVDRMSPTDQQRIDAALAKALYSSNTPFAVVENEYWRELFNLVRPSYALPSRYLLSGPLLDAEFQRQRIHVEELLKSASYLTLLTEGWTNIRGESIVNFIVATPEPLFYKCVDTGDNRHTATYISSEIRAVIESLGSSKVVAVVTDNASNMKAACDLVTQHYPHVTAIGCAAHGLNLLMNDLMGLDTLRELNMQAREVIEYVKRSHIVAATFKQKQESNDGEGNSVTLKLPSKTRWAGVTLSLESLARNKMALKETVIIEDLKVKKSVRQTVLDEEDFWSRVNSALSLLNTISSCIASAESNMALLSDVPCLFHRIREDFDSKLESSLLTRSEQEAASDIIRRRENFCVQPIHYAANVLDPRYEGKNLENEEPSAAFDWLSSQAKHFHLDRGIVLSNFAEYRAHRGIWSRDGLWESAKHCSPSTWWEGLCAKQPLTPLACSLLQIPPSSASCERNWSEAGNIHTKLRNRLTTERVEKLLFVHSNLNFQKKQGAAAVDTVQVTDSESDVDSDV